MRGIVFPYKMESESAKLLAGLLDAKRVRRDGAYIPRDGDRVVNWGNNNLPDWHGRIDRLQEPHKLMLNWPINVKKATNKIDCFDILHEAGVSVPDFTTDANEALAWIHVGHKVLCRTIINGKGGAGIELAVPNDPDHRVVPAPLYVKYIPKKREFRVHVVNGIVIDFAEKRMRNKEERPDNFNLYIRNHNNGWVFCRNNVHLPDDVVDQAIAAVKALQLDFGAVDIIWNERREKAYVLEVNTAPGLDNHTAAAYANAFKEQYDI